MSFLQRQCYVGSIEPSEVFVDAIARSHSFSFSSWVRYGHSHSNEVRGV